MRRSDEAFKEDGNLLLRRCRSDDGHWWWRLGIGLGSHRCGGEEPWPGAAVALASEARPAMTNANNAYAKKYKLTLAINCKMSSYPPILGTGPQIRFLIIGSF
jgi:hypothetical protein